MNKGRLNALVAKDVVARGDKGEQRVSVLFDTGAAQSFVLRRVAEAIGTITRLPNARKFSMANGSEILILDGVTLELELANERVIDTFLVIDNTVADVILGESTMRKFGLKIDLEHGTVFAALRAEPCLKDLEHTHNTILITQEEVLMNKLIARLREIYALAADATEDQILAKVNDQQGTHQVLVLAKNKIIAVLGAKADATSEEIERIAVAAKAADTLRGEVIAVLGLSADASNEAIKAAVATVKSSSGELPKLMAKVTDLEKKEAERSFMAVIDRNFREGRILPVQRNDKDWLEMQRAAALKDISVFEAFWAKQPVVGPVQGLPEDGTAARVGGIAPETLAIAKQLNVDEATLKKYNQDAQ